MFGLRTAPGDRPGTLEADEPVTGLELHRLDARRAVRGDPVHLDVLERLLDGLAEPVADPLRVAGDLDRRHRHLAAGPVTGVLRCAGLALPLDEERELRVGLEPPHAELLPAELGAIGAVPVAVDGHAPQARLVRVDVVDGDDPAEPAAS